jgi:hypothetical protein
MILAAPLVIPFAKAVGLSVGTLGMAALADKVNDYIETNPEESAMILKTLIPNLGIGEIFMNKEKISIEDLDEMSDQEAADLPTDIKADLMKQGGKSRGGGKRELMKELSRKLGLSGPGKEQKDMEYDADERYEGGVTEKADGGAIGIEVLFTEKKPRKDFNTGGRATTADFAKALKSVSAGTTYQQQRQAKDYARQEASNLLSQAIRSGNQSGLQSILQGVGGITSIPGMQFNRSGNRITSVPATGPGRDAILNAMANQMLSTTSYAASDPFKKRVDELDAIRAENQRIVNQYMQNNPPALGIITGPMGGGTPTPPKLIFEDQALLSQLTKLTPEQATYFDPFEQLSDIVSSSGPLDKQQIFERIYGLKDGGRVGFDLGGLTGPAKNIYDSMMAAGYFTEDEIRNAIIGAGYEIPGASPAQPEQVTGIIGAQLNQDRDDGPKGDFGLFGNLLKDTEKTFTKNVYTEIGPGKFDFVPTEVTGYKNVKTGNYQTEAGKNINHLGLEIPTIAGMLFDKNFGKGPQVGDIEGTFTKGIPTNFFKNPFGIFKKQQATIADINAMNKKAVDELRAKQAAEKAAKEAARAAEMARYNITSDSDFGGGIPGGGGGNVRTTGGDVYGGAAYGYNEAAEKTDYFKDGGLASMFVEKR